MKRSASPRIGPMPLPLPVHHVDYETLVADFENETRQLIAFLGLAWEPACLEFYKTERAVRTASTWQVRQPLYDEFGRPLANYAPASDTALRRDRPRGRRADRGPAGRYRLIRSAARQRRRPARAGLRYSPLTQGFGKCSRQTTPSPVTLSYPGPAAKRPLLPSVMSVKKFGVTVLL